MTEHKKSLKSKINRSFFDPKTQRSPEEHPPGFALRVYDKKGGERVPLTPERPYSIGSFTVMVESLPMCGAHMRKYAALAAE